MLIIVVTKLNFMIIILC